MLASNNGHSEAMKVLIDNNASVDIQDNVSIYYMYICILFWEGQVELSPFDQAPVGRVATQHFFSSRTLNVERAPSVRSLPKILTLRQCVPLF